MRDWEQHVRDHLTLPDLAPEREVRIVRELASQLEEFYSDAIARGLTETDADAHARAQIPDWPKLAGTLTSVERPHARSRVDRLAERFDHRARATQDRWPIVADVWLDMRHAARRLAAQPGFTVAALLTLGIGIGLCCLLFAFLNGLILQPLPGIREPDRLVSLSAPVAFPYFEQYRAALAREAPPRSDRSRDGRIASAVAAFIGPVPFNVTPDGGEANAHGGGAARRPERVFGHIVSLEYFEAIGVEPLLGRFFGASNADRAGTAVSVVVSERFWRTRLNADPAAIGRTLRINGGHATIVGVAAKDFLGVFPVNPADVFIPLTAPPTIAPELGGDALTSPSETQFRVIFRLAPGQTPASAGEAIAAQTRLLDQRYGVRTPTDARARPQLLAAGGVMPVPPALRGISTVFYGILILLILSFTCTNLAGLMLARGDARGREIAVRLSLGASRFRLVRQLLSESLLLAIGGGLAGFISAYALLALLVRSISDTQSFSIATRLTPDLRVAWVTFVIAASAGMLFGLIPALASTRPDLMRGLKDTHAASAGAGRYRRFGVRNLFVVYQMTAATAVTVVVGFMVAGVLRSASADLGTAPDRAWLFSLDLTRDGYTRDEARTFLLALPDRLAALNGIDRVSFADDVPFNIPSAATAVSVDDAGEHASIHSVAFQHIGPGYFAALGVPLLRGAEFIGEMPAAGAAMVPVVINQTAARELFGERDPLGAVIRDQRQPGRQMQVVGVVRYGRPRVFASEPPPMVMLPLTAADLVPGPPQGLTVIVRSRVGAGLGLPALSAALASLDSRASAFHLRTVRESVQQMDRGVQYGTALYSILGTFAIGLASIGLAGVTAQAVVRRRKEIGIRMALGARRGNVLLLVMREAIVMVSIGVGLGLFAAAIVGGLLSAMSVEFSRTLRLGTGSPLLVLIAPLLLMLIACFTCYLPARRSSTIDPLITLRDE